MGLGTTLLEIAHSLRMWRRLAGWCAAIMGKTKKSFYAVKKGRSVGVYNSWAECEAQVKGYPGAVYKGFMTQEEAESFAHPGKTTSARERYSGRLPSTRSGGYYGAKSGREFKSGGLPIVYSDGSCFRNGTRDATAGIGVYWGPDHAHNVSEKLTGTQTNQRAELVSACRALESAVSQGMKSVEVRTDSSYTIKAMTEWIERWRHNGWQTAKHEDVKNKEDLMRLDSLCKQINVRWTHVPGHRGVPGNEAADRLAKAGSLK